MGYETRIYISRVDSDGYCNQIAMIDLCKCGDGAFATLVKKSTPSEPKHYLYVGTDKDGDENKIDTDMYDSPLSCMDATKALEALRIDNLNVAYRRFTIAIALIEKAIDGFGEDDIKIVGFGH